MNNFEERFLEELAKARARLEGKEAYDDEAIKNEFDPDLKPEKTEETVTEKKAKPAATKTVQEKPAAEEIKKAEPESPKEKIKEKKPSAKPEKLATVWGGITVALSLIISGLVQFVPADTESFAAIKSYLPFAGIVFGASAVICGASFIKNNKKGVKPLVLGLIAIIISAILPSL